MTVATPAPPRRDEPEALIEEAWEQTRRRRRMIAVLIGLTGLIVGGVVIVLAVAGAGGSGARERSLGLAAQAHALRGEYWYSRTVWSGDQPAPIMPRVMRAGHKIAPVPVVYLRTRTAVETWIGGDGTMRQREVTLSRRFASAAGRARWLKARQPGPAGGSTVREAVLAGNGVLPAEPSSLPSDPGDSLFTLPQLLSLPSAATQMGGALVRAELALQRRQREAFVQSGPRHAAAVAHLLRRDRPALAGDVLRAIASLVISPIPDALRVELVHAGAAIPGVRQTTHGSQTTLVTNGSAPAGPVRITFNADNGRLVSGGAQSPGTIVAQGLVNSLDALPKDVKPLIPRSRVPPIPRLTPDRGAPTATFTLQLPASAGPQPIAQLFGPTGPDCHYWYSHPGTVRLPVPTTAGNVERIPIASSAIGRSTWCTGNYQLQVPIPGGRSFGTGDGLSAYFEVH